MRYSTYDYCQWILEEHKTPYTTEVAALLKSGDYERICALVKPDASTYSSADLFRIDYMAYNLLRKYSNFDLQVDKRANAIESFRLSELSCRAVNNGNGRLTSLHHRSLYLQDYSLENSNEAKLTLAKELIAKCLGKFDWNRARKHFGFSGGATTRLKRNQGHPYYKYQGKPEVTRNAARLAVLDIELTPLWGSWMKDRCVDPTTWVDIVQGSRADTVPKDSETERFICLEPDMNMYMQRGVGKLLRESLRNVGVYLDDQSLNQKLAFLGSRTGSLATIDLKSASDSISLSLVRLLLPSDWYDAICHLRSEYTNLNGEWIRLEKVSSMGNGFTFELESLIFWALSQSVLRLHHISDTRLAIYGDDIVIHNSAAEPLELLLNYVGFTVNSSKTHVSGPFRESCGEHYFYGENVTPFYVKEPVESEHRLYWLLNSYAAWLDRAGYSLTKAYRRIFGALKRSYPNPCFVPIGYGFEAGIEVSSEYSRSVWSLRKQAFLFRALVPVRERHDPTGRAALLAWLSKAGSIASDRDMTLMKGDVVYARCWRKTSQWASQSFRATPVRITMI